MKQVTQVLHTPYVGLRPFGEREAMLFFGREQHTRELLTKLEGKQRFIAVLGASGTGKSSLVRAGLVPALHRGALASAGYDWNVCILKPGDEPLTNLAQALTEHQGWRDSDNRADAVASLSAALAMNPLALTELYRQKADRLSGQALLLVVDQFEEIFRYRQKNVDEAESFINLLLRSATEDVPIYVAMTMRSDFLGKCAAFFGLPEAINRGIYLTPRLGPDQLKSIIVSPLALVGGEIDPVLVSKLVNTLGGEDELPIMEHALLRMWNRARAAGRASIETEDFEAVCALHSERIGQPRLAYAIDNHASQIYETLSSQQQRIARQLFLALVERRDGQEVRWPQTVKQLVQSVGEQERENLLAVIEAFRAEEVGFLLPPVDTRLDDDRMDDRMVDMSHESLFRQWHLFRQWLNEEDQDASELKEWQHRAARQKEGGGWLDEYDCERAHRWLVRINQRTNPVMWATRYEGPVTFREVDQYIESSVERLKQTKAEQERLEREAKDAETKRLELEATMQRQAAERAEAERRQAEKEKQQAQEYADASRRKTRIAMTVGAVAVVLFIIAAVAAWWANQERGRADLALATAETEKARAEEAKTKAVDALAAMEEAKKRLEDEKTRAELQTIEADRQRKLAEEQKRRAEDEQVAADEARHRAVDEKTRAESKTREAERQRKFADEQKQAAIVQKQFAERQQAIAVQQTARAEKMARDTIASDLAAKAENLANDYPDQSALLGLAAWKISPIAKSHGLIRAALGNYSTQTILRGHKGSVRSAQFSPDGKTVVTASDDKTARLWRCVVCGPIDELAVRLRKAIGRDLTDDERRRYGVPDWVSATK